MRSPRPRRRGARSRSPSLQSGGCASVSLAALRDVHDDVDRVGGEGVDPSAAVERLLLRVEDVERVGEIRPEDRGPDAEWPDERVAARSAYDLRRWAGEVDCDPAR